MGVINKKYLDIRVRRRFYLRFFCSTLILILLIIFLLLAFNKAFSFSEDSIVNYKETGSIDYKIFLKENDFYDTPFLGKNMAYVASLINKVNVDFTYKFNVDKESYLDVKYNIIGNLVIASQNNSNVFFEKQYVLKEDTIKEINNDKGIIINENIEIDYDEYNNLVNSFRTSYAVSTTSYLEVYLQVEEKNKEDNSYKLFNTSKTTLKIPLSQQEININLNDEKLENENKIVTNTKYVIKDVLFLIISIIILLLILIYLVRYLKKVRRLYKLLKLKDNNFDKHVNKILKCYDRIIVNVCTLINFDDYKLIKVVEFQELVDVRDNIKEVINYYLIEEHEKCVFYIVHNDSLYYYMVRLSDLNEEINDEKK